MAYAKVLSKAYSVPVQRFSLVRVSKPGTPRTDPRINRDGQYGQNALRLQVLHGLHVFKLFDDIAIGILRKNGAIKLSKDAKENGYAVCAKDPRLA
jgi:hypothetical protein